MKWPKLKNPFSSNGKHIPLKQVYKDRKGNKYFVFKDTGQMPHARTMNAYIFMKYAEMSVTKERLVDLFARMEEAVNNNKMKDIATFISLGQSALNIYAEEETLLRLASVHVLMNDEDPLSYANYVQKAKRKAWDEDRDAKAFFLTLAYGFMTKSLNSPALNVLKYLDDEKTRAVLKELDYHLPQAGIFSSSWET